MFNSSKKNSFIFNYSTKRIILKINKKNSQKVSFLLIFIFTGILNSFVSALIYFIF